MAKTRIPAPAMRHAQLLAWSTPAAPVVASSNGLRRVQPFEYHFHTPVKPHWIGRPLCQVVAADFTRLGDPAVVANMVRDGDICLSGRHADTLQPIKASDTLHARVWRSDPDVLDDAVDVVYSDDQFLAVSKPHSIPIHSNARYVHNTLVSILERQGYRDLKVTHRLDALTTGLVILARTSAAAADISLQLREGKARKMYLARVLGHMAENELVANDSLPAVLQSRSQALPQPAITKFKVQRRLELGKLPVTLVECHPQSGRFHQIRRHLAGLGHPIINDPLYNPRHLDFAPFSRIATSIGQSLMTPFALGKPELPIPMADRLMGIDLCAAQYEFPDLGLSFQVENPPWAVR